MPEYVRGVVEKLCQEISKTIVGQSAVVEQTLVALFAQGHVLLEGVPGTAKTLMVKTLTHVLGAEFHRIQFTPDLMPSDVTGTNIFNLPSSSFSLRKGPVFTDFLLADEINRTPPKTQAALLEAMEERQVTIDGERHPLPEMFTVLATQNPIEYEGTYPLPEAQLDRFLLKILIGYPSEEQELEIVSRWHTGFDAHRIDLAHLDRIGNAAEIIGECRRRVTAITVEEGVQRYIVEIVRRTREAPNLTWGSSPRASVALLLCSKSIAAIRGRAFVTPDDVKEVAHPVLRHRIILRSEAEIEGVTEDEVIDEIVSSVPVPR